MNYKIVNGTLLLVLIGLISSGGFVMVTGLLTNGLIIIVMSIMIGNYIWLNGISEKVSQMKQQVIPLNPLPYIPEEVEPQMPLEPLPKKVIPLVTKKIVPKAIKPSLSPEVLEQFEDEESKSLQEEQEELEAQALAEEAMEEAKKEQKEELKFLDMKTKKSFLSTEYKIIEKETRKGPRNFAIAISPSGGTSVRLVSKK